MSWQGHGRGSSHRNGSNGGGGGYGRSNGRERYDEPMCSDTPPESAKRARSDGNGGDYRSGRGDRDYGHGHGGGGYGGDRGGGGGNGGDRGSGNGGGRGGSGGGRGGGRGGGGRGRGGGGRGESMDVDGGGGRGARRGQRADRNERFDLVRSRPETFPGAGNTKMGSSGTRVQLETNFFPLLKKTDWCLYNYRVDFNPEEERTPIKKALLRPHQTSLGAFIFDGSNMWTSHRLAPEPMVLYSIRDSDKERIELKIKFTSQLDPGDVTYLQFYNIIVRKCLQALEFEELGRHFYDRHAAIRMQQQRLELWPGYITTMRNYENQLMLCVDVTHKVLSLDNCNTKIQELRNRYRDEGQFRDGVRNEIVGCIVMTRYNRKTYRVDDIDWNQTPADTFDMKGEEISFADYFSSKYQLHVSDMRQPLFISRPTKRDVHRGQSQAVRLIPEICLMTGLSDDIRSNFNIMRDLARHLHQPPDRRFENIKRFMTRIKQSAPISAELSSWGLDFDDRLRRVDGRVVPKEQIIFKNLASVTPDDKADWRSAFRNQNMFSSKRLDRWVILVTQRDSGSVDNFVRAMTNVGRPLGFPVAQPLEVKRLGDTRIQGYVSALDEAIRAHRDLQLFFIILPNNKLDLYAAVKRRCCIDIGIASQCFVAKNMTNPKGVMSIATKVVIQINAKLGGEPWAVANPLKASNTMVIGFDVYHCGKRKGQSVGAMVATTSKELSKFYSTVSFHESRDELTGKMATDITKCLMAFKTVNGDQLPDRIIMFRDGVGDGQLNYVYNTELAQIKMSLKSVYESKGRSLPRFSLIIVTKKINARIALVDTQRGNICNPQAGTIVDDVITLPERWDFYLVAQHANQGTVSPTCYNVLFDQQGLDADKIQRFAYKLCHMYYNWSGTVAVPAPCQYAHKLAYLTGLALKDESKEALSHQLFYL